MNHNPSSQNATATHPDQPDVELESYQLNPSLQQALSCLDIKLEDELTRFRHKLEHREADPQSWQSVAATSSHQPIDAATDVEVQPEPAISSTIIEPDDYEIIPASGGFIIIDGTPIPESSFTAITRFNHAPLTVHGEDISVPHQSLDLNFSPGGQIAPFREEYIASSQELLRQIQAGATTPPNSVGERSQPAPAATNRQWVTPLKLGSVAAACVIIGAGTYTYFNPTLLAPLTATKVGTVVTTTNSLGQIIQSPNLAANEFTELTLSNLNSIKIATATPTNIPSTIANVGTTTTAPTAIPFTPVNTQTIVPPATQAQPRLADSLVKSLLPSNFQAFAKSSQRTTIQPGVKR